MSRKFSREELELVANWLEDRAEELQGWRMSLEADDFAHSNGKWPRVEELRREEFAVRQSLSTARDQQEEISGKRN